MAALRVMVRTPARRATASRRRSRRRLSGRAWYVLEARHGAPSRRRHSQRSPRRQPPRPDRAPAVRETLAGIARQHAANPAAAPRQAAAIAYDDAIRLLALARQPRTSGRGIESAAAADARGQRDAAIVALLFCAGMRRSEVADLRWQDVEPTAKPGQLRVRVRRSKTNQDGQREDFRLLVMGLPPPSPRFGTCPTRPRPIS